MPFPPAGGRLPGAPLIVLTGGTRGITARAGLALAQRGPCTLVLLARTAPGTTPLDEAAAREAARAEAERLQSAIAIQAGAIEATEAQRATLVGQRDAAQSALASAKAELAADKLGLAFEHRPVGYGDLAISLDERFPV